MNYYYLCASLPSLAFGTAPLLDLAGFDALCKEQLSSEAFGLLQSGHLHADRNAATGEMPRLYREYTFFEQYLRTRIAQRRTAHDEVRSLKLPELQYCFAEADTVLGYAAGANPAERERAVDQLRWRQIDDLEAGHDFDLDWLCAYRLKLEILEKYRERKLETGRTNFNGAVDRIAGNENQNSTIGELK